MEIDTSATSLTDTGGETRQDAPPSADSDNNPGSDLIAESQEESSQGGLPESAHAKAIEFRRNLRMEVERLEDASAQPSVLQAAAWVDLGDDPGLATTHSQGIQRIAEELKEKIDDSGLDPASPEYRRLWNRAVRESDWKFRARYGARAWTRHHIQAHHMASANQGK